MGTTSRAVSKRLDAIEDALLCHQQSPQGLPLDEASPEIKAACWLVTQLVLNDLEASGRPKMSLPAGAPAEPPVDAGPGLQDMWEFMGAFRAFAMSNLATAPTDLPENMLPLHEELRLAANQPQRSFAELFEEYKGRAVSQSSQSCT
jgi:hypothetical protein